MRSLACLAAALVVPALACAAGPAPQLADNTLLDFAVQLGKTKTTFDYRDGRSADTTLEWAGITWYEHVAPRIELGLYGGRALLTQTDNPATAGIEPDGYYAGIGLRAVLAEMSLLQLFVHATYTHQRLIHEETSRSVTLSWDTPRVQLGATLTPRGQTRLYAGADWASIDGQERVTGSSASTTNFERRGQTGGFVGVDLAVERDGYIGIEAYTGIERGVELYFKKRF